MKLTLLVLLVLVISIAIAADAVGMKQKKKKNNKKNNKKKTPAVQAAEQEADAAEAEQEAEAAEQKAAEQEEAEEEEAVEEAEEDETKGKLKCLRGKKTDKHESYSFCYTDWTENCIAAKFSGASGERTYYGCTDMFTCEHVQRLHKQYFPYDVLQCQACYSKSAVCNKYIDFPPQ